MIKNKIKISLSLIFEFIFLVILINSVLAETGCCFSPSTGFCTANADKDSCVANQGEFLLSPSCSSPKCDKGCCILGDKTRYSTSRECQLIAEDSGFELNFQTGVDQQTCMNIGRSMEEGACLSGEYKPFNCKYTTYSQCSSGNFYPNLTCTHDSLNTKCQKTNNFICEDDDVYALDSCGNKDGKKEDCDYNLGTICDQNLGKCRSLDCEGGKRNGESWCVDYWARGGLDINTDIYTGETGSREPVGGRDFTQYCLNGKLYTEPCDDLRGETCEQSIDGSTGKSVASCKINNWFDCFSANLEEPNEDGSMVDEDACNPEYCEIWKPAGAEGTTTNCYDVKYEYYDGSSSSHSTESVCANNPPSVGDSGYIDSCEGVENCDPSGGGYTIKTVESVSLNGQTELINTNIIADLHLERCVPKVKGGEEFWSMSKKDSVCAMGNYEGKIIFMRDKEHEMYYLSEDESCDSYGTAGLIGPIISEEEIQAVADEAEGRIMSVGGIDETDLDSCTKKDADADGRMRWEISGELEKIAIDLRDNSDDSIFLNGEIVKALKQRCKRLSDCAAEWNWLGEEVGSVDVWGDSFETLHPETGIFKVDCKYSVPHGHHPRWTCSFELECNPWKANPGAAQCGKCGEDNLPCSEYRCKALGQACEYKAPDGIDKGYCVDGKDRTSPSISLISINPPSPIPPYYSAEFTIATDKVAYCKFNFDNAGTTYSDMEFDFGEEYSTEHKVKLNIPGQVAGDSETLSEYPLITSDGKHTLYIRCVDVSGNGETKEPFTIDFEVMQTPDNTAPFISAFNPLSGSPIKFNTSEKKIEFQMNEPAECKWSLEEKSFEEMNESFICDEGINEESAVRGYYKCEGTLKNINKNLSEQTKFYIKCKDQPWIVNDTITINNIEYSRNTHENNNDYEYLLKASEELIISEVSPSGNKKVGSDNLNVTLSAITSGGGYNGKSECLWRISNSSDFSGIGLVKFAETNSNTHRQVLTYITPGINYVQVRCKDNSSNVVEMNSSFNFIIDLDSPIINRIYYNEGKLKVNTEESGLCYYSFDKKIGCIFDIINGTLMTGTEKEHSAEWQDDKNFYVKCKDYFGNYNSGCSVWVRTY